MKPNRFAGALLLAGACTAAWPAEFSVTPVRIFMTPRDRAVAVTIANEGDEEIVVQSELYHWAQDTAAQDDLKPTDDLVLSPPIVRIPPKSRQVVRLARVAPPPTTEEKTYRLIVREVPEAKPSPRDMRLQVAIAFSLPIFITPPTAKRALSCLPERVQADTVRVSCRNTGRAYAQPRSFTLLSASGEKLAVRDSGGYVLPEVQRSFELKAPTRIPGGPVRLEVGLDDGSTQAFEGSLPD